MFLAWLSYRRQKKRLAFMAQVVSAIAKLDQRDRDLLCRAFSQPADADGLFNVTNMTRKEIAEVCNQYYVRDQGKDWDVAQAFRDVLHNIRTRK